MAVNQDFFEAQPRISIENPPFDLVALTWKEMKTCQWIAPKATAFVTWGGGSTCRDSGT